MRTSPVFARHSFAAQVGSVALVDAGFVLLTDAISFRSPANAVWMFGLPVVVAVASNRGWRRRALMFAALMVVSCLTSIFMGVHFTSYR
jgi:peptidoglycan/LPS O-acetylase OafA/YrhL